jgi:hypothetical protein
MKLLNSVKQRIIELGGCKAARTLAHATASACNQNYGVSLLSISVGLDLRNTELVLQLLQISKQSDFSNDAQYEMLNWLEEKGHLEQIPMFDIDGGS